MKPLLVVVVVVGALSACIAPQTGDFALCCTCLNQKSPVNDGNAVDVSTNCLPDAAGADAGAAGEADQCNQESADFITDPGGDHPIHVVDEVCTTSTCNEECAGAVTRGAKFVVTEAPLSGQ